MARTYAKLFEALRSAAVKSLLTGIPPGPNEWSTVFSALIGDLVEGPDAALTRLVSIDQKLDDLLLRQYLGPLKTAHYQLRDARAPHRSKKERARLLHDARNSLREALQFAPESHDQAEVHWCLAMAWLADQHLQDCLDELYWSAAINFNTMTWGLGWIRDPPAADLEELAAMGMSTVERLTKELGLGSDGPKARVRVQMQRYIFGLMQTAQAGLATAQRARRALGVHPGSSLVPTISQAPGVRGYTPAITVRGLSGQNSIGGLTITVDRAVAFSRRAQPGNGLDVEVTLSAGDRTSGLVVGFQPLHGWTLDAVNLVGRGGLAGQLVAERMLLGSGFGAELGLGLPGRALLAGPSPDRVLVAKGRTVRGWIRTDCRKVERALGHKLAHAQSGFVGLRVEFGPRMPGNTGGPWTIDLMLPVVVAPPTPRLTGLREPGLMGRRLLAPPRSTRPSRIVRTRPRKPPAS